MDVDNFSNAGEQFSDDNDSESSTSETHSAISWSDEEEITEQCREGPLGQIEQRMIVIHDAFSTYSSDNDIKKRILSDSARFGKDNMVEFKDVEQFRTKISAKYEISQIFLCCICEEPIRHGTAKCDACNVQNRATKEYRPTGIATASLVPQIAEIIRRTSHLLVRPNGSDRSELGHFPLSQLKQIDDKTILLRLMMNTDGVSPKQNFIGSFWPVFFEITQLPAHIRGLIINTALAAIITCGSKPPAKAFAIFAHKTKADLIYLRDVGIEVNGLRYKFDLGDLIMDLDAIVFCYNIARCQSISQACIRCRVFPNREGYKSLWPLLRGNVEDRRREDIHDDMRNRRYGFDGITPLMEISNPLSVRADGLHILDEGLLPRILDLFLKKPLMSELSRIYLAGKFPSYFDPRPRSLLEYNKFNGGDKRLVNLLL
uniref:Uncharacterized protein n=1 Tax=Panagrolaimus sp. ES5 TaxID=591445 RepID=A0AC34FWL7_9BILA